MCEWKRGTCRLCSCCPLPVTRNGARALQRHWPGTTGDAKVVVTDQEPKPHEVFHGISIVKPWAASLYEGEASPWRRQGGSREAGRVARERVAQQKVESSQVASANGMLRVLHRGQRKIIRRMPAHTVRGCVRSCLCSVFSLNANFLLLFFSSFWGSLLFHVENFSPLTLPKFPLSHHIFSCQRRILVRGFENPIKRDAMPCVSFFSLPTRSLHGQLSINPTRPGT